MTEEKKEFYKLKTLDAIDESKNKELWENLVPDRDKFAEQIVGFLNYEYAKKQEQKEDFFNDENQSTVLAINAEYGMGKTYFAKALHKYIEKDSVYFSVWKKDYIDNPLVAFSQEIANTQKESLKQSLKKAVWGLVKSSNVSIPGVEFDFKKFSDEFFPEEDGVIKLKKVLESIVEEQKHLVIIVDELDRCRPDYAVKVLETIKHFFDVKGLSFVLPINKNFLEKSIEGFYNLTPSAFSGKEHYLTRFIPRIFTLEDNGIWVYLYDN
ncbi:MAG TPA: hypothetical protein DCL21_02475, partial [Alphaproteobacteria bacterium]|nr:hypothetical protein [Alphaproteobacteria bacterium]